MTALSAFVPDVRVEIPEIPSFVAERQLLRAAREFCEETRTWRVDIQITTVAATATTNLTSLLPANTELVDIVSIKNIDDGGTPPAPSTFAWLDKNVNDWRSNEALNAKWFVLDGNNTLRLVPTPSTAVTNQYFLRVAVKPLLSATVIDDVVANKYDELLIHGALAKLFLLPRKPWTDAGLAQYHQSIFLNGIPPARTEAAEEFQTGIPRKVKYGGI